MKLYHRTKTQAARAILANGFKDRTGYYMTSKKLKGVFLSNEPDCGDTLRGILLLVELNLPEKELSRKYELKEKGKPYREFVVPAAVVNAKAKIKIMEEKDDFAEEIKSRMVFKVESDKQLVKRIREQEAELIQEAKAWHGKRSKRL